MPDRFATMVRLDRPGHGLTRTERPLPEPAAGEVLLAVEACGVCRTDLQLVDGDLPARALPVVPGHQVVGRVFAVGDGVEQPSVGQRVGVAWIARTCGTCRFCTSGRENLCESATFTGWDRDGGYATHTLARADFTHPLDESAEALRLAPLLCGGAIGHRCLRATGLSSGARLGLYGFGASATVVVQLAHHLGMDVYVATRSPAEQERARALGATWAGGYDERPPVPLDAAITFAPAGAVVLAALDAVDRGAPVIVNAIHLDGIPAFSYDRLWWERSIRSVANVTRDDVRELVALAAAVPVETQVESYPLAEAGRALDRLRAGTISGAAVLVP